MTIKIAPSILSSDFAHLQDEVDRIETADVLHVDVMDGHFVPNLTFGAPVLRCVSTNLFIDSHLMVTNPEIHIKSFKEAKSDRITFHIETAKNPRVLISEIRKLGCGVGITLNPDTSKDRIADVLGLVDAVLVMSVFPGFGGQEFIGDVLPKIKEIRKVFSGDIAVDGGINLETGKLCVKAGANVLVAGSFIFKNADGHSPEKVIAAMRALG
ncbi:MAG: ribulose-phosphate 3-epimerase [archaeon]